MNNIRIARDRIISIPAGGIRFLESDAIVWSKNKQAIVSYINAYAKRFEGDGFDHAQVQAISNVIIGLFSVLAKKLHMQIGFEKNSFGIFLGEDRSKPVAPDTQIKIKLMARRTISIGDIENELLEPINQLGEQGYPTRSEGKTVYYPEILPGGGGRAIKARVIEKPLTRNIIQKGDQIELRVNIQHYW
jgi:hypothetical protein